MSDDVQDYYDDGLEFHSPFNLGFDPVALETFKWLVAGHLLYLIGLAIALLAHWDMGNVWITPLFGLPMLWVGRKKPEWARIFVFLVGFTAIHYLAVQMAVRNSSGEASLMPGLVGGAIGAVASLALCWIFRLFRPGGPTLVFALFGAALLAFVGGVGVYMYLNPMSSRSVFLDAYVRMLWVYVPWQIVFAYVMAKALKPISR
jgi:hypothetical protein